MPDYGGLVTDYGGLVTDYGGFSQIMGFSARLWAPRIR